MANITNIADFPERRWVADLQLLQPLAWRVIAVAVGELFVRWAPESEVPADLDSRSLTDNIPADVATDIYNGLVLEARQGNDNRRAETNSGLEQTPTDRRCHEHLMNSLFETYPGCVVVGEEATTAEWDERYKQHPVGTRLFVLDSIDGSAPHDSLGFGFSVNVLMYVKTEEEVFELALMLITTSSGISIAECFDTDRVYIRNLIDPYSTDILISEPHVPLSAVRSGFTAVVGALPEARRRAAALMDTTKGWGLPDLKVGGFDHVDPPLSIFTTGGAPVTAGLALLHLDAMVTTDWSTVHDACGLLALVTLGIPAYWIDTQERINLGELKGLFSDPQQPPYGESARAYKPIGPHVVCRDDDRAKLIASRLSDGRAFEVTAQPAARRLRAVEDESGNDDEQGAP